MVSEARSCVVCGDEHRRHYRTEVCYRCYKAKIRIQGRATYAVLSAVRKGDMPPASAFACVDCGGPARHYEHRYYSRPLDVVPTCQSCNFRRGPAADLNQLIHEAIAA